MMNRAFTLIELLIVVAIIGILAAIAVPNFINAQTRAKVSRAVSEQKVLAEACVFYALDYNNNIKHDDRKTAHNPLTTPIAYIQAPVWDRFKTSSSNIDYRTLHGGLVHIEPFLWVSTAITDMAPFRNFKATSAAMLMGFGPAYGYGLPYNSTNGIVSLGGIYRLVPKAVSGKGREEVRQ